MEPKSFSATALHVAELCLARYNAEHISRGKGMSGTAASLGTSVHGALEMYVKQCVMETNLPAEVNTLLEFFRMSYLANFSSDMETEEYLDGVEMLKAWYKRTDFSTFTVISSEVKNSFPVPTTIGPIPFNYIWDRFDQVGEREFRVVDYKTNRWPLNPQDLRKKIQPRAYALACAIQLKEEGRPVDRIWVEFDMLRHDGPVGIVFSREENAAMWRWIKDKAQEIVDTPPEEARETINAECNFCSRKISCGALQRNIAVGGLARIQTPQEAVDLRATLEWQKKGIQAALNELDDLILTQARELDLFEFESDMNRMRIGVSSRRAIDADRVALVIGDVLFNKYGGKSFTLGNVDKLLKGSEITDEQKSQLRGLIYSNRGEPRVSVEPLNPIDGD